MTVLTRRSLCMLVLIVLIGAVGVFGARYRRYAYATIWHYRHGATIKIGEQEIEIPRLWWATNADKFGRISILRAYRSSAFIEPEIEVSPASLGQVEDDDVEQSRLVNKVVATISRDPETGWTHSVVNLRAKNSTWYCIRDAEAILGQHVFTSLTCNASRVPFTLIYQGPPEQEKEAETIFTSFQ